MTSSLLSTVSESEEGCFTGENMADRPWLLGQLDLADLASVDPGRGRVLQKLQEVRYRYKYKYMHKYKHKYKCKCIVRWPLRRPLSG